MILINAGQDGINFPIAAIKVLLLRALEFILDYTATWCAIRVEIVNHLIERIKMNFLLIYFGRQV